MGTRGRPARKVLVRGTGRLGRIRPAGTIRRVKPLVRALALLALAGIPAMAHASGPPPTPAGTSWILADGTTGEVLAEYDADRRRAMASTTKIMTALVALESGDPDRVLVVPPAAALVGESSSGLRPGERMSVRSLLTALLVQSGNDAAVALAYDVAGSEAEFVARMNQRARVLGMMDTMYRNPHGLDADGHYSSARDLLTAGRALMGEPLLRKIVGRRTATIPGPGSTGTRRLASENDLLAIMPEADGIKTGHTDDARYSLVAHATSPRLRMGLYAVLLGEPDRATRASDARALLRWGFGQYARPVVLGRGRAVVQVPVQGRPGVTVGLVPVRQVAATVRLGQPVSMRVTAPSQLVVPLPAGAHAGTVAVMQGEQVIARAPLATPSAVEGAGLLDHLRSGFDGLVGAVS